jgi:hypothetical protein
VLAPEFDPVFVRCQFFDRVFAEAVGLRAAFFAFFVQGPGADFDAFDAFFADGVGDRAGDRARHRGRRSESGKAEQRDERQSRRPPPLDGDPPRSQGRAV